MSLSSITKENLFHIREKIKQFSPREFLEFISFATSIQTKASSLRLLHLIYEITLTIPESDFKGQDLTGDEVNNLISYVDAHFDTSSTTSAITVSSFDYPPIWLWGKRYRIISGLNYQSYKFWKNLAMIYFPLKDIIMEKYSFDPTGLIQDFLNIQTKIFNYISANKEKLYVFKDIILPDLNLLSDWSSTIQEALNASKNQNILKENHTTFKSNNEYTWPNDLDNSSYFTIKLNNFEYILPPAFTLVRLLRNFLERTLMDPQITSQHYNKTDFKIFELLTNFFGTRDFRRISIEGSEKFDFALLYDGNKLFLFDMVYFNEPHEKQISIDNKLGKISNIDFSKQIINIRDIISNQILPIDTKLTAFYFVIIITTKFNVSIKPNQLLNSALEVQTISDFNYFINDVRDPFRLVKFLRTKQNMKYQNNPNKSLALYSYFSKNNDSLENALPIDNNHELDENEWTKHLITLWKKTLDFQPQFDPLEEDEYWKINKINDSLFFVKPNFIKQTAYIVKAHKREIWILTTLDKYDYSAEELHSLRLVSELLGFYIINRDFSDFLDIMFKDKEIMIILHPDSHPSAALFNPSLDELLQTNITRSEIVHNRICIHICYSFEYLRKIYQKNVVDAERTLIKYLLNSIYRNSSLLFSITIDDVEKRIENLVNKLFDNHRPGFNAYHINIQRIPKLTLPSHYYKNYDADLSMYEDLVAIYLRDAGIKPGKYIDDEAKKIINSIVAHLDKILKETLSKYNYEDVLEIANINLAQVLQTKFQNTQELLNNFEKIKLYDPVSRYNGSNKELLDLVVSNQFLLENLLQLEPKGKDLFTVENYLEVQSLCQMITTLIILSDHIHYGTQTFILNVNERNICKFETNELEIIKHFDRHVDNNLYYASQNNLIQLNEIDEAFKDEFKISFTQFATLLSICYMIPKERNEHYITIGEDELTNILVRDTSYDMESIVTFLNVAKFKRESETYFPTKRRNRKNRLIIFPLIYMEENRTILLNSWLIFNALLRWENHLSTGYLPFNDRYITSSLLKTKLQSLSSKSNRNFEITVEKLIKRKTKNCAFNIKNKEKCFVALPEPTPGEIDSLAIFPETQEIFVIDEKDLQVAGVPKDISSLRDDFIKKNGYLNKILKKKNFVEKFLEQILDFYGIQMNGKSWTVRCFFVTSTISFINIRGVMLLTINEFEDLLADLPDIGK